MSRRLVFALTFIAAALALAAGVWWQYPVVTLAGGMGLLLVFAGGVYAALPTHRAPRPAPAPKPGREAPVELTPVADDDYDATFTVVAHHPAEDAQRRLWGPPGTAPGPAAAPRVNPPMPVPLARAGAPAPRATPAPPPRAVARAPPPPPRAVLMPRSEWARPESVTAVETPRRPSVAKPASTRGLCSHCGTHLTLSAERPLRATCPVCGHSKVLN